jgi:internalin A
MRRGTREILNIWDFGGQDIYHGVHTLFLKTQAIFLVAWHPVQEAAPEQEHEGMTFRNYPLSYWLEYVRTLSGSTSPVVVTQCRCDSPEDEVKQLPVPQSLLQFPFLKPCWYSARLNRGRAALEEAIHEGLKHLRKRDGVSTIGTGRMKVLRQLEEWREADQKRDRRKRRHRTLSLTEFRDLCARAGGVRSPDSLLEYLHNLGVVFYRSDLFQNQVILDQSWALDAVYAVFDRQNSYRQILGQHGRFTRSLLEIMVWQEYAVQEQRLFLTLMQSCGIAFQHRPENKDLKLEAEFIAPDLLPDKEVLSNNLAGRWKEGVEGIRLEYEYDLLHPGLIRSLICDAGNHAGEAGVYWKYGVWLYDERSGCQAIIEQQMVDERKGRITARIQGTRFQDLGLWLRSRLEERNRLFGYPDAKPVVDEFPNPERSPDLRPEQRGSMPRQKTAKIEPTADRENVAPGAADPIRTPAFAHPPPSSFSSRAPEVFVSYAWGDSSPEGQRREKLVDDLCSAMQPTGITIRRDRDEIRPGDRISEFMKRLADGDLIITVISDRYLRSLDCMTELFQIYRNSKQDDMRFLKKVIPLVLPDARLRGVSDRLEYAAHWGDENRRLKKLISKRPEDVGSVAFEKFRLIGEIASNTSDMLEYICDTFVPRDYDRMAREGFKEVLDLIGTRVGTRDP